LDAARCRASLAKVPEHTTFSQGAHSPLLHTTLGSQPDACRHPTLPCATRRSRRVALFGNQSEMSILCSFSSSLPIIPVLVVHQNLSVEFQTKVQFNRSVGDTRAFQMLQLQRLKMKASCCHFPSRKVGVHVMQELEAFSVCLHDAVRH
jgi:hypothetical protein